MTSADSAARLVSGARRRWLAARWLEALAAAAAVAAGQLALLTLMGVPLDRAGPWALALLSGAFAAASWIVETHEDGARFARRLDRALDANGALSTAYELEREGRAGALVRLQAERALHSARGHSERGFGARPSPVVLGGVALGLAALAWSVERAPETPDVPSRARRGSASLVLARASEALERSQAGERLDGELASALAATLELNPDASEGGAAGEARTRTLEQLSRWLSAGPADAGPGRAGLESLARKSLAHLGGEVGASGSDASGSGSGPVLGGRAQSGDASGPRTLAGADSVGTMSGSSDETPPNPMPAPQDTGSPSQPSTQAQGRWWPAAMDEVVTGYVARIPTAAPSAGPSER